NLGGGVTEADQYDNITDNNSAVAVLTVLPVAELEVRNLIAAGPYYVGVPSLRTIQVINNGPDAATNVSIKDLLVDGLQIVESVASIGTFDATTGIWTFGSDLLAGEMQ